jgi:hypothetical protein
MEDELELKREDVKIEGDRNLYNYTFTLDGKALPPLAAEDTLPMPPEKAPSA